MTLLDAEQYDPKKAKRRKIRIAIVVATILVLAGLGWLYRNWPEERAVDKFFDALQKQDYETAYSIYFHDPKFRDHLKKYAQYPYSDFYRDWGPGGEWGLVKAHKIYGSAATDRGVIVEVIVNGRAEHARMFVDKTDKTITVYPY